MMALPVHLRAFSPEEHRGFVFHSWLRSFREGVPNGIPTRYLRAPVYFDEQEKLIHRLLTESSVALAVNPEDLDQIFGYVVYQSTPHAQAFHYCYVKEAYRRFGLATQLIQSVRAELEKPVCTHLTKAGEFLVQRFQMNFNPYWASSEVPK